MRHYYSTYFIRAFFLALLAMGVSAKALAAAAAKVEFAAGNVTATALGGQSRGLIKGADVNAGDSINTNNGQVQIRFTDGGFVSLKPNTIFKIQAFNFNNRADGSEKAVFGLVKGGLRTITGTIGKANRQNYEMRTATATIGIRGTAYSANQTDTTLSVFVSEGEISVTNEGGSVVVKAGQSVVVDSPQNAPQIYVDKVSVPKLDAPQTSAEQETAGTTVIFNEQVNSSGHADVFDHSGSSPSPSPSEPFPPPPSPSEPFPPPPV